VWFGLEQQQQEDEEALVRECEIERRPRSIVITTVKMMRLSVSPCVCVCVSWWWSDGSDGDGGGRGETHQPGPERRRPTQATQAHRWTSCCRRTRPDASNRSQPQPFSQSVSLSITTIAIAATRSTKPRSSNSRAVARASRGHLALHVRSALSPLSTTKRHTLGSEISLSLSSTETEDRQSKRATKVSSLRVVLVVTAVLLDAQPRTQHHLISSLSLSPPLSVLRSRAPQAQRRPQRAPREGQQGGAGSGGGYL